MTPSPNILFSTWNKSELMGSSLIFYSILEISLSDVENFSSKSAINSYKEVSFLTEARDIFNPEFENLGIIFKSKMA